MRQTVAPQHGASIIEAAFSIHSILKICFCACFHIWGARLLDSALLLGTIRYMRLMHVRFFKGSFFIYCCVALANVLQEKIVITLHA